MLYHAKMREQFGWVSYVAPVEAVKEMVQILIETTDDYPTGSSFAVTANTAPGSRMIHLSASSAKRVGMSHPDNVQGGT